MLDAKPDVVFNTLNGDSNVAFFKELKAKGITPDQIQTVSVSVAEEEVRGIGVDNIDGQPRRLELLPDHRPAPRTRSSSPHSRPKYGADRVTDDPIEAGYNAVYIWAAAAEKAGSFDVDKVKEAAKGLVLDTPEGTSRSTTRTSTSSRRPASARSTPTGLIDEVWASDGPDQARPLPRRLQVGQGPGERGVRRRRTGSS